MNQQQIEVCAQAAHEANRVWCISQGDTTQSHWEAAPEWQKASAIRGVQIALGGATPEQQHEAWSADKIRDGWKYGPVKDADKKEHHCLVPYNELPAHQRAKDSIYIAVVTAFAAALTSLN